MKKFITFFTAFTVFLFIFTACGGKGNQGKQEISDGDPENSVSDGDNISDNDPENQTPEKVNCKADGSEEFLTYAKHEEVGCRGSGCILRGISRKTEEETYVPDIYKLDGNILWLANIYNGLISVDVSDPKKPKRLGNLKIKGTVTEIHLHNGTLFVVSKMPVGEGDGTTGDAAFVNTSFIKIIAVDISDPSKLSVSGEINIRGRLAVSSKRTGDILYFALQDYSYRCGDNSENEVSKSGVMTVSLDIKDPKNMKIIDKFFVEVSLYPAIHISEKSVYIAESGRGMDPENESSGSLITMLDISSGDGKIVKKAEFQAKGVVNDQRRIYEKGTTFYAASSSSDSRIIESFDVSDPSNIKRLSQLEYAQGKVVENTMFDGGKMYASLYVQYGYEDLYLEIVDISDPSDLKQLGTAQIPPWSQFVVRGNHLIAIGKNKTLANNAIISMYDISDPENIKTVNSLTFGSNYIEYLEEYDKTWLKHPVFQVFDDQDIILLPVTEKNDFWQLLSRLYVVSFDIEKGLEVRGFVESESSISRGVALKDSVLAISDSHLFSANLPKSGKLETAEELVLAETVPPLENCGGYPCGFLSSKLHVYDPENGKILWKSSSLEIPLSSNSIKTMKNSFRTYIYGDNSNKETSFNEILKVIEFSENGSFKETDFKSKDLFKTMKKMAVSENNIVAYVTTWDEKQLSFFDMNDLGSGIKQLPYHFDFGWISRILVNGNTFWVSWCKEKGVDYSLNQDVFLCYASPVDVSDPANPKAGEKINIPGMLSGISDNGRYLYTDTFEIQGRGNYDSVHYSYILELNAEKTGVCVIKKETVEDYTYENTEKDGVSKTTRQYGYSYPKNNTLVLTSDADSISVENCRYTKETPSSIKIISDKGKEVFNKTFEGKKLLNNVQDGGFLVLTDQNWTYITPEGKKKAGIFSSEINISNTSSYSQLINDKIYLPVNGSGIISFDVK